MPQNSWIDGAAHWKGRQLDEVAAPILLAWQLRRAEALSCSSRGRSSLAPPVTSSRTARSRAGAGKRSYCALTLAAISCRAVCAADLPTRASDRRKYRDFFCPPDLRPTGFPPQIGRGAERGELLEGKPRHYMSGSIQLI